MRIDESQIISAIARTAWNAWPETGLESVFRCPVCESSARTLSYHGLRDRLYFCAPGEWNLHRCASCGTGYLDPRPTAATIALAYSKYFTHAAPGDVAAKPRSWWRSRRISQRNAYLNTQYQYLLSPAGSRSPRWISRQRRHRFDKFVCFLRYPGKGARALDIGCGNGRVMMQLRSAGWDVSGIEIDAKSAARAVAAGLDVRTGMLKAGDWPNAYFDAITMNHVIEHVHDPIGLLRLCAQILKPGGQISLATPNFTSKGHQTFGRCWLGLDPPRHLVLFTPDSLCVALESCGFRVEPALRREPIAGRIFRKSMHIRLGSDPRQENPPLPLHVRMRAAWLAWNANRGSRTDARHGESIALVAIRR